MSDSSTRKILLLVAHPHLRHSRANRAIVETISDLPGVTTHRLYDHYPYFQIDVEREKSLLLEHDLVFVQHPFYWYSVPPLLKLWMDEVLESGWAYGPGGYFLKEKDFQLSITVGGSEQAYTPNGQNRFTMDTLLAPWNQTVHLCQMRWNKPIVFHSSIGAAPERLRHHAQSVRQHLLNYHHAGKSIE